MSGLGQTRASVNGGPMSGFTSKAAPISPTRQVSNVPFPDVVFD